MFDWSNEILKCAKSLVFFPKLHEAVFIGGKITEVGTFQELVQAQRHFSEFLEEFLMNKVKQRWQSQDERDCEFHFNFHSEMLYQSSVHF